MPIMEVVLRGRIDEQLSINRFNYLAGGTPAAVSFSFALFSAMGFVPSLGIYPAGTIMSWLLDNLTDNFDFDEVQVRDVYSVTDFYSSPFPAGTDGLATGEGLPPFSAYGFRSNRVRSDIRRGTRRFAGVNESVVGDGGLLTAGGITLVNDMADLMSEVLEYDDEGNTLTLTPIVVKKEEYTTSTGRQAYRYYSTQAAQLAQIAIGVSWEPYTSIRSQVSRQYGHGA